jgi:hypothetical protein
MRVVCCIRILSSCLILFILTARVGAEETPSAIDQAISEIPQSQPLAKSEAPGSIWSAPLSGSATLQLMDISFDAMMAVGGSTEPDPSLQTLQGGEHDPRKRGFTLQQVELSLAGAVDPYVRGDAYLVYFIEPLSGDSQFELEEAFLTTLSLPWGLQIKGGQFFTEFGRLNPQHPHAWSWQDQPLILTRLFGGDGLRGLGARLGWLMPLPWFSELYLSAQNANGETMVSFLANDEVFTDRPIGGRPFFDRNVDDLDDFLYLARLANSFSLGKNLTTQFGLSGLFGPNATGPNGVTWTWGGDLALKWRPAKNFRGWPFVIFEGEFLQRIYEADFYFNSNDPADPTDDVMAPQDVLHDYGLFTQVLYGFYPGWAAGARYEFADARGANFNSLRSLDPYRDERHRASPLLIWFVSEFFRLRLQYNFDHAQHIPGEVAHSVWGGAEFSLGAHPAHRF